jgi:hypothetical protein
MDLFNTGFPDCDVDTILRTEMQYSSNGELDFQFDQPQYGPPSGYQGGGGGGVGDPTLTSVSLGSDHHARLQQYRTGTGAW